MYDRMKPDMNAYAQALEIDEALMLAISDDDRHLIIMDALMEGYGDSRAILDLAENFTVLKSGE